MVDGQRLYVIVSLYGEGYMWHVVYQIDDVLFFALSRSENCQVDVVRW